MNLTPELPVLSNPVSTTGTEPVPGLKNVYMKPGVVLTAAMKGFARELQKRTGQTLVITSGVRTPAAQAAALAQDYSFGVYGQGNPLVAELRAGNLFPSAAEMTAILENQVAQGRYLSRHMRGDALDFRISGLTPAERQALLGHARAMVGKDARGSWNAIDEGDHIHVEELGTGWAAYALMGVGTMLGLGAVTLGGLGLMWWYRDRIRQWLP